MVGDKWKLDHNMQRQEVFESDHSSTPMTPLVDRTIFQKAPHFG